MIHSKISSGSIGVNTNYSRDKLLISCTDDTGDMTRVSLNITEVNELINKLIEFRSKLISAVDGEVIYYPMGEISLDITWR